MKLRCILYISFIYTITNFGQSWNLIWSDEFEGPSINTSNWVFEIGNNNGWGNNELEYYTSRPENAKIENGQLVITARQESYGGKSYTSARMKTQGKRSFKYGKIEAYIKIPMGQGSWPAFWMLGDNISFIGWPKCGEIDIMEHVNNASSVNGTIHWANAAGAHVSEGKTTTFDVSQYHLYTIEWNSAQIKWFIDYKPYFTFSISNSVNSTEEFHLPHFILLNLAIGGNWPGNPNGTMQFPISMNVDYVRVYEFVTDVEKTEEIPSEVKLLQNYPNPFNPETKIGYQLAKSGHVSLEIYDTIGNKVKTLVDEYKNAGNYNSQLSTLNSQLSSGVYLAVLKTGGFVKTQKLVLMK